MTKLMIGRTAISGVNLVFTHAGKALRIAWFPYLLLIVAELAYFSLISSVAEEFGVEFDQAGDDEALAVLGQFWQAIDWQTFALLLVSTLAYALLTVGWIRFILRGEIVGVLWFGGREVKLFLAYVLWTIWLALLGIAIWLITTAAARLDGWIAAVVAIVLTVVAMLWTARLLMIFPMISLNQGMGWIRAWRMTKGNGWRLLIGFMLSFLLGFVIVVVVNIPLQLLTVAPSLELSAASVIDSLVQQALSMFFLMVLLGSLAEAYRQLNGPGMVVPEEMLSVFDD